MKKLGFVLFLFIVSSLHAQIIDKEQLYRTWCLDKYSDDKEYYLPPKKEREDYITINKDGTYKAKSTGEIDIGTWMFNTNGNYIELKNETGDTEKLYLYFLSKKSLVVVYHTDAYRIWEVHYVSCN